MFNYLDLIALVGSLKNAAYAFTVEPPWGCSDTFYLYLSHCVMFTSYCLNVDLFCVDVAPELLQAWLMPHLSPNCLLLEHKLLEA